MAQIDDLAHQLLASRGFTGDINQQWHEYFESLGIYGHLPDQWKQYLKIFVTGNQLDDLLKAYLGTLGYTGSVQDRLKAALAADNFFINDFVGAIEDQSDVMQGVLIGTGVLTEDRSSTVYVPDYNGTYRWFDEPVWKGAYQVLNICPRTDSIKDNWTMSGVTAEEGVSLGGVAYTQLEFLEAFPAATVQSPNTELITLAAGEKVLFHFKARTASGSKTFDVKTGPTYVTDLVATDTEQWFCIPYTEAAGGTRTVGWRNSAEEAETDLYVREPMVEFVHGRTDETVPSDYFVNSGGVGSYTSRHLTRVPNYTVTDYIVSGGGWRRVWW